MAPNEWERQRDSKCQRQRGRIGATCGKRNAFEIVHLNRNVRKNVGKAWKGKSSEIGIWSSVCAHSSGAESRRRTHSRGLLHLSSCSSSSSPLCLQHRLWAPVSFQRFFFVSLLQHALLFYSSFFFYPPIPPFLYFWLTVAPPLRLASGPSHNQQHARDS